MYTLPSVSDVPSSLRKYTEYAVPFFCEEHETVINVTAITIITDVYFIIAFLTCPIITAPFLS